MFETGFTNLQFVGLSALAHGVGDRMFEKMVASIQSDEARHAQIGAPVLATVVEHDRAYAQRLLDKWFWRSWLLFAVVTGFAMDYFTPVEHRQRSFKEFMDEWVLDQFLRSLDEFGLQRPWYWDTFLESLDNYHHMVYASAYTLPRLGLVRLRRARGRASAPGCARSTRRRGPTSTRSGSASPSAGAPPTRGTTSRSTARPSSRSAICASSSLSNGTPRVNTANILDHGGRRYVFCSRPCRWIFEQEPERYARHKDVVKRVLAGEAPANLVALVQRYFGLDYDSWGKDAFGGDYPWLQEAARVIPLYGFLEGDTIGLLVLAEEDDSIAELARKLQAAARLRVAIDGPVTVIQDGKPIDPALTVAEAGLQPLARIDVRRGLPS